MAGYHQIILPRFEKDAAPSKLSSNVKVKAKLAEFEEKYKKTWPVLLEEELMKARAELAENAKKDHTNVAWDDFRLDEQSDAEGSDSEVECIAEETGI